MDLPSMGDQPPPSKPALASLMQWKNPRKESKISLRKLEAYLTLIINKSSLMDL